MPSIPPAVRFFALVLPLLVVAPMYLAFVMYGTAGAGSVLVALVTGLYLYGELPRHFLSRYPGPPSRWLIGHLPEFAKEGYHEFYERITKEYGRVVAVLMGHRPILVVAEPELVRQVGLEQFDAFKDRMDLPSLRTSKGLLLAKGAHWQSSRKTLNPAFNSIKLSAFAGIIGRHCDTLVKRIDAFLKKNGEDGTKAVDILKLYQDLTMDVIGSTSFDAEFKLQDRELQVSSGESKDASELTIESEDANTRLLEAAQNIFGDSTAMGGGGTLQIFLGVVLPFLFPVYKALYFLLQTEYTRKLWWSINVLESTMKGILSGKSDDIELSSDAEKENYKAKTANFIDLIRKARNPDTGVGLDEAEVRDQLNLFVLAGYETTANTLTYTSFLLAQNPKVEAKLVEEIDRLAPKSSDQVLSFKDLADFTYLNWVVNEALRLYPPGAILTRYAERDVVLRLKTAEETKEYPIRKGTNVVIPVYSIHRDEAYWENPLDFDPERFSPERSEGRPKWAHLPFGIGPRNCIGQRFALEEAKLALIALYRDYTFQLHEQTKLPLKLRAGITMSPHDGVFLTVQRRQRSK